MISKLFHLADIHIRKGNLIESRFQEYDIVFDNTISLISALYTPDESICVICGDLFHHKLQISSHGIVLFNKLLHSIANLMPLFIIQGNHDLIQEYDDENNDLISALLKHNPHPNIKYFDKTTSFTCHNLHFGITSIRDILSKNTSSGLVDNLPLFPKPMKDKFNVALSHVTVQNALLHNYTKTNGGVPLEWFKGYNLALLGDIHLQTAKYSKKYELSYGYPGSLVQQDFGEGIYNHGFLLWKLNDTGDALVSVKKLHVHNPFGRANLKIIDDTIMINSCNYESFDDFLTRDNKPKQLHIRLYCKENTNSCNVRDIVTKDLHKHAIESKIDILTSAMLESSDEVACQLLDSSLCNLRLSDTLIEFYKNNCSEEILNSNPEWDTYIKNIENVKLASSSAFNDKVSELIDQKNSRLEKKYNHLVTDLQISSNNIKNSLHILDISFDWILPFGSKNIFKFNNNRITLINAPNGFGKSAFFECITLGLFGETIPSRHNRSTSLSIINCKRPFNIKNEVSKIKVVFRLNNKLYTIIRDFHEYNQNNKKRLHSLLSELYEDDNLLYKNSKLVNKWVVDNVCSLSDFLLSTMITQNFDNDFFKLKSSEQNELFDSVLNMKTINDMIDVIKESKKEYRDLKNHIDTFLNALRPTQTFDLNVYDMSSNQYNTLTEKLQDAQMQYDDMLIVINRNDSVKDNLIKPDISLTDILAIEAKLENQIQIFDIDVEDDIHAFDLHDLSIDQFEYDEDSIQVKEYSKLFEEHKNNAFQVLIKQYRQLCDKVDYEQYTLNNIISQKPQKQSQHTLEHYKSFEAEYKKVKSNYMKIKDKTIVEKPSFNEEDLVIPYPNNKILHSMSDEDLKTKSLNHKLTKKKDETKDHAFNPECWACNENFVDDNDAQNILNYREKVKHLQQWKEYEKNKPIMDQYKIFEYEQNVWKVNLPIITQWNDWNAQKNSQENILNNAIQRKNNFTKCLHDIFKYQSDFNNALNTIELLKEVKESKQYYYNLKLSLKYQIDAYHKKLIDLKAQITTLDIAKTQENNYNEQKACLNELVHTLEKRINLFTHLVDTYTKYKSWIYNEKLLPAIVSKTNSILRYIFTNRELKLCFKLENDQVLFTVRDEGNDIHMEKLSGAQSFAISLSFRLALSSVGITRFSCDQLFIDEGFCSFDKNNLLNVPELIKNLKQLYSEIILVTHLDEIKSCADTIVNITRDNGVSKISNIIV